MCPPGDADRCLGPGWTSEWTSERATERTIGGENRSEQETTPPDVGTDQNLWQHSCPPKGGLKPREQEQQQQQQHQELGSEVRGQRGGFLLFFFFCLRWQNTRERTAQTHWWWTEMRARLAGHLLKRKSFIQDWTKITGDKQGLFGFWTLMINYRDEKAEGNPWSVHLVTPRCTWGFTHNHRCADVVNEADGWMCSTVPEEKPAVSAVCESERISSFLLVPVHNSKSAKLFLMMFFVKLP